LHLVKIQLVNPKIAPEKGASAGEIARKVWRYLILICHALSLARQATLTNEKPAD
jgi:hypothetical protein